MPAGVIVAGGRSTRFGKPDKAVAPLAGVPMIRRVADRVDEAVDELIVNCREDQRAAIADALSGYSLPSRFAVDTDPGTGPMAGIRTGLAACDHDVAVVLACDMPFVDPKIVSSLFDHATGHDAVVPRLDDGWFQTTHAVYRRDPMVEACDAALARGERRVVDPLFELDYAVVGADDLPERGSLSSFENVNTREEFERAETRLERT
ncbi:molybdenum cofactor guanylyltransferase [Haladaptatus sp. DYF46]|uniref:molybdenum cofactor guanylyltransferase n=1 Tax=Haladaptatus sp. DYF46 TaxID=2886041 RepID=UPI001E608A74|nr:molybdenum cofactor guanylyltransferase [Haladaptatus sp. DYF46]